jgi:hypothetical protein
MVQLAHRGLTAPRVLPAHLGYDGLHRMRVGAVEYGCRQEGQHTDD